MNLPPGRFHVPNTERAPKAAGSICKGLYSQAKSCLRAGRVAVFYTSFKVNSNVIKSEVEA